jgi:hypothetical protein
MNNREALSGVLKQWKKIIAGFVGVLVIPLDLVGRVQVAMQYSDRVEKFLNSGWGTLATVGGGFALIAYAVYRGLTTSAADDASRNPDHDATHLGSPDSPTVAATALSTGYIAFEHGVLLFQKRLDDSPHTTLEQSVWFAVLQRSRIANEADANRYVTMRFQLRTGISNNWVDVSSSNVWFKRPGQFYSPDLLLSKREQVTLNIGIAISQKAQKELFGSPLGTIRQEVVANMAIDIMCTARDMANDRERVFEWKE